MAKYNIVIDTETTGLPKSRGFGHTPSYTELDKYNECRMVQIAWIICDNDGNIKSQKSFLIQLFTNLPHLNLNQNHLIIVYV